ncbi:flagellar hook-associated protein FlgK [Roseibacterium sp. SDUM158017]|uniref:flagellar hook-associated protein FlgK n=1 Tax=Roseicyclus salinarum TaxID=3036773 RepID=UPI002414F3B5|nr:flagellar hook-associated protein FlgK [Roseibacterium sp. SDUM158017]MDG4648648.1 flagellar hook-associated protein FlgK [Roseibacterium sp. SDUM158017]
MGITSAFSASQSGLAAVEKWAEITAGNIANADRAGFVRKSVTRGPSPGGGVQVTAIRRETDAAVERLHRIELSRAGRQEAMASGLELYTSRLGEPGSPGSLLGRIDALQSAFTHLANGPDQLALQSAAVEAAKGVAGALADTSAALSETLTTTLKRLEVSVGTLNSGLTRIGELNRQIAIVPPGTDKHAALLDEAGALLDNLSELADLRAVSDGSGRITVYTAGGTALVEGTDARILRFDEATAALFAGDVDITPGRAGARGFEEGGLAGQIFLVGEAIPLMRRQLDETARALIEGFEAADASLAPGDAGLFTDNGAAYSAAGLDGLAERIAVNMAVRPETGGEPWRLRDGINAAAQGPASDATQLYAFVDMLESEQPFDPSGQLGTSATIAGFAASLVADQQQIRVAAQERRDILLAGAASMEAVRSGISGVNRDDELQQLIEIEQSYAANSTVIRTLGEMLDTLLAAF